MCFVELLCDHSTKAPSNFDCLISYDCVYWYRLFLVLNNSDAEVCYKHVYDKLTFFLTIFRAMEITTLGYIRLTVFIYLSAIPPEVTVIMNLLL